MTSHSYFIFPFNSYEIQWTSLIVTTSGPSLSGYNNRWILYPLYFCNTVDSAYNIHRCKGQPVTVATKLMSQNPHYNSNTAGYKSHRLLWPLKAGPEVATISGVHCKVELELDLSGHYNRLALTSVDIISGVSSIFELFPTRTKRTRITGWHELAPQVERKSQEGNEGH